MTQLITFTDAAVAHVNDMIKNQKGAVGFRLAIKKTGCSGYAYQPSLVETPNNADLHFMAQDNLAVYVDPAAEKFIEGLVIDYVSDNALGLKQKRLVFINPNEKNRCGCGESFTVD